MSTQNKAKPLSKIGSVSSSHKNEARNHKNLAFKTASKKDKKNIEDLRKEFLPDQNKTNLNLKRLLALSQNSIDANVAKKIIQRSKKGTAVKMPKKKKVQESIFTEEDFLAFEKEYFADNSH
ncbi:PREDICTED: active regulator of SIRT1-like isoform X2 [Rhagoletis zephyria]|uniref:active regulator of SIRT1-like isoform X2 n=1 Tax=Rhagoletis zephyria TaxID=28612 RepID=UPI000811A64D|nr:PREDICTED: active regulator of SIRT1-like isoform X2 [Rhagoletis zephyria]